ncbi:hypothetical protein KDN32_03050 [Nocardioides sp. J2M5]|uniref:hypothetical protein n=1 Tax=Nocardioides palaemonis TaxID=2829810 RepID=UPI001BA8C7A7|nr:hypothetical protein [Nocardioides palaemonis]MBS2936717.1 hypothetical protein [Nocardioides palaemonis]
MTRLHPTARRLLGSTLAGGVVVATPFVVTVAPAVAAAPVDTTTVATPNTTKIEFGQTVDIALDVDSDASTSTVDDGTSTLYAREATSTRWTAVSSNTSASLDFLSVRPRMTTTYKVVYGGYDAPSAQDDSFASSESAEFTVGVARTITYPTGGFEMKGRVRPAYGKRTIVIKVSDEETSGFKKYRKIRTDRRGRYSVTLPRRSGEWFWTFIVRADDQYRGTRFKWRTWAS